MSNLQQEHDQIEAAAEHASRACKALESVEGITDSVGVPSDVPGMRVQLSGIASSLYSEARVIRELHPTEVKQ